MSALTFRLRGALRDVAPELRVVLERSTSSDATVHARTARIIERVRDHGDAALLALARELDGVELESLEVRRADLCRALDALDAPLRTALERAATNIAAAHRAFAPRAVETETEPGIIVGRRADPLDAVGIYAPGGRAAYPSSVLMGAIPARAAGVGTVILCSPPSANGLPAPVVLAAAALAQVDRVFALGGAGAIAAMAYGTATVPRVSRIVGPGNAYVAEAKLQLAGYVGIDAPAGPSELLVIADEAADPAAVAREALAQAEHDPRAAVVVVALGREMAVSIERALGELLDEQPRGAIIRESFAGQGALLWCDAIAEALAFSNAYAPEHLLLALQAPERALRDVRNAGTVFLGETSSVAFGDYMTGANHVLPTGGAARSFSGLSTLDFVRWTTYQRVDRVAAAHLAPAVARLAEAEGLPGHAAAARGAGGEEAGSSEQSVGRDSLALLSPREATGSGMQGAEAAPRVSPRPTYDAITLYAPDRTPCAIDLSDNTNLWGASPAAERVAREAGGAALTRYPALYAADLKGALADYAGVERDEIVTGCGSDDVLDSAIRAFAEPGDRIAYPDPSFAMLPIFARMNGLEGIAVPLTAAYDLDAEALLATGARVIYLCSPNNPTGTAASRTAIERVIERAPGLVILDEAYAEFMGESVIAQAPSRGNLLVTRTLSKAFGLAGLRIGYAAGHRALVAEVEKSRGPYKVSTVAERAALAALRDDMGWVRERIADVRANRRRFAAALAERGLAPLPSAANFVLVPVQGAMRIAARMRELGVAVRPFEALPGVGDALRITIGPWAMMEAALGALEASSSCA